LTGAPFAEETEAKINARELPMPRPGQVEPQSASTRSGGRYARWLFVGWMVIVVTATVYLRQPALVTADAASFAFPIREEAAAATLLVAERKEEENTEDAAKIEWLRNVESVRDCDGCPEMVVIPDAGFLMGSPNYGDRDQQTNESPPRRVSVRSVIVARHEASLNEWTLCVDGGGCTYRPDPHKPPYPDAGEGTQPVTGVSWNDAQDYVRWLGRRTGKNYRLLTEAEWASAARVGITAPIGSFHDKDFDPNKTKGNAWEWVQDCYVDSYSDLPADGSAFEMPDCGSRVLRGGWWTKDPGFYGRRTRRGGEASVRDRINGFRVARTP
jgi:formylglycine-generating enzyme required for sulfatase activity